VPPRAGARRSETSAADAEAGDAVAGYVTSGAGLAPRGAASLSPLAAARDLWRSRDLIRQLSRREVQQRYRGSFLGIAWSMITPLLMLAAYTFVFSVIFQARWSIGNQPAATGEAALILFAGLIPFSLFAECLTRAPNLVVAVPNYVKKVVFPLETLPVVQVSSACIHSLIGVSVLLLAEVILLRSLPPTLLLLPLAYLPLVLLALGTTWLLAALCVYLRDVGHAIGVLAQVLLFFTPIFYPVSAAPGWLRPLFALNPLTTIVDGFRAALLGDPAFPWTAWTVWTALAALAAYLGYCWFVANEPGFADVL